MLKTKRNSKGASMYDVELRPGDKAVIKHTEDEYLKDKVFHIISEAQYMRYEGSDTYRYIHHGFIKTKYGNYFLSINRVSLEPIKH